MADKRRSPESFLEEAHREQARGAGGRLKVFFGAAPGVGKTYAMLQDAAARKAEGVDVVAGVVETHKRRETEALLAGLEILPRRKGEHRGVALEEFDLDGALARKPALLLVDELAHTNAPGSRHDKRWQDVLELLQRGISVYSTLNVQHLETLNNVVAQITGVSVRETVPDIVLEAADVELVDLTPEELLKRLKEGKVYMPELAQRALENYFKLSNLNALRELALRVTAQRVGVTVESQRLLHAPEAIWPTAEKLLVCVSPSPTSAKLVRAAKRMAAGLKAEWLAVFVDSSDRPKDPAARAAAMENLRLAERLGAETLTVSAPGVVEGMLDFARQRNVTKIIVGKHFRPRWREFFGTTLVDDLIRESGDIDVYVITGEPGQPLPSTGGALTVTVPWQEYALSGLILLACTALCFLFFPHIALTNIIMIYLLGTMLVAFRGWRGPAIAFSAVSVLLFDFFFVPPRFSVAVADTQYIFTFLVMFAAAVLISHLTLRLRSQAEKSRLNEMRTGTMHALSRRLAETRGQDAILEAGVRHIAEVFDSDVIALTPGPQGGLAVRAHSGEKRELDEKERSVAQWVFDLGQSAGLGTQTLPVVEALYAPLIGAEGSVGVLRVQPRVRERLLIPDQMLLLESFAHQVALSLEVDRLQDDARHSQIEAEKERLRSTLLSSVSHDLRTPLAAIIGSATSLLESAGSLDGAKARELLSNIQEEGEWLTRLVNNLIETTRLETGAVRLSKEPLAVEEVLGSALERVEKLLSGREVAAELPEDLPLVPADGVLLEQVFVNLLENAARHTPPGTPVQITAAADAQAVTVDVADRGPGLPPDALERVFDKFYRASSAPGAGLGLAICRAIANAHGGRIWAENRPGGGAVFHLRLPLGESHA